MLNLCVGYGVKLLRSIAIVAYAIMCLSMIYIYPIVAVLFLGWIIFRIASVVF